MNKYIAVIQARVGSSRFPNKVLQPLGGYKSVIEYMVRRLALSRNLHEIVLAIPNTEENEILANEAERLEIKCVKGEENNLIRRVLRHFYGNLDMGTRHHFLKESFDKRPIMVDITSDCPFVCPYMIDYGIEQFHKYDCDYVSNIITRSWPDGFDFQIYEPALLYHLIFPADVLQEKHLEHTGWNILNYNDRLVHKLGRILKMLNIGAVNETAFHPDWGLTLDTKEDYELIEQLCDIFIGKNNNLRPDYSATSIIGFLNTHKEILETNREVKRKIPGV